ncbi:MAG: glycosyltransferase [Mycobacterium sp.]|nr:glycosyltransferase [Mycobacterium sp.]
MHGQYKLSNEGYRTRDGHIIEWLGRWAAAANSYVEIVSRPEPAVLAVQRRVRGKVAVGTRPHQTYTWRAPRLDPKHWWVRSARAYPRVDGHTDVPVIAWNPFAATASGPSNPFTAHRVVAFDLLDDWTIHHQFVSIRDEVDSAYGRAFEASDYVFANSEATLDLAKRYGRPDAVLMPNGVDPERFSEKSAAHGPITVGYIGKIGQRLDSGLITSVCSAFPDVQFVFAGHFPDTHDTYRKLLHSLPNVQVLGDVHYEDIPALLSTFDLGWVPHSVGEGEVGGDAIKIYEYRAAGLQVLTTPILGAGRTLRQGVHVVPASEHADWIKEAVRGHDRLPRVPADIPDSMTWKYKAGRIAEVLNLKSER